MSADKLSLIYKKIAKLNKEIEALTNEARKIESDLRKGVTVTKRQSSTVLSRPDGLSWVFANRPNTFMERKIYWYVNGKKGEYFGTSRNNINELRLMLALYDEDTRNVSI